MKHLPIAGALALALFCGACTPDQYAAVSGALTAAAPTLCKQLMKTAPKKQACKTDTGLLITVGDAVAAGVIK